ncbi:MAG: hypothetical protein QM692_01360 [Thermomicrobiales bacterium]
MFVGVDVEVLTGVFVGVDVAVFTGVFDSIGVAVAVCVGVQVARRDVALAPTFATAMMLPSR